MNGGTRSCLEGADFSDPESGCERDFAILARHGVTEVAVSRLYWQRLLDLFGTRAIRVSDGRDGFKMVWVYAGGITTICFWKTP